MTGTSSVNLGICHTWSIGLWCLWLWYSVINIVLYLLDLCLIFFESKCYCDISECHMHFNMRFHTSSLCFPIVEDVLVILHWPKSSRFLDVCTSVSLHHALANTCTYIYILIYLYIRYIYIINTCIAQLYDIRCSSLPGLLNLEQTMMSHCLFVTFGSPKINGFIEKSMPCGAEEFPGPWEPTSDQQPPLLRTAEYGGSRRWRSAKV